MSQKRIDELEYWLRSGEPRAKAWRRGQSADHLRKMGVELAELSVAEKQRQEQERLQAALKKYDEGMAARRQEREAAAQAAQAAVEEARQEKARERLAGLKRRTEAAYRQAGGDAADFEKAWESGLKDQAIQEETARERRRQESQAYVPRM